MVKTRSIRSGEPRSLTNSECSRSETNQSNSTRGSAKKISPIQIYKQLTDIQSNERPIAKALLTDKGDKAWDQFVVYHLAHTCGQCPSYPSIQPRQETRLEERAVPTRIVSCVKLGLMNGKRGAKVVVGHALEYGYQNGLLKKPDVHRKCYELIDIEAAKESSKNTRPVLKIDKGKLRPKDSREIYRGRKKTGNRNSHEKRPAESDPTEKPKSKKFKKQHTSLQILSKSNITTTSIGKGEMMGNVVMSGDNLTDAVEDTVAVRNDVEDTPAVIDAVEDTVAVINPVEDTPAVIDAVENTVAEVQSDDEDSDAEMPLHLEASNFDNENGSRENESNETTGGLNTLNFKYETQEIGSNETQDKIGSHITPSIFGTSEANVIQARNPFVIDTNTAGINSGRSSPSHQDSEGKSAEQHNQYDYFT